MASFTVPRRAKNTHPEHLEDDIINSQVVEVNAINFLKSIRQMFRMNERRTSRP